MRNKYYPPTNKDIENHQLETYKDEIKQLELDLDMSDKNKKMFYRLWIKWANKSRDIESSIHRLNDKIKTAHK